MTKTITTKVAGVTFENRQGFIAYLAKNIKLSYVMLKREPTNRFDKNAIRVIGCVNRKTYVQVGYLPKELAKAIAPAMDSGHTPWVNNFRIYRGGPTKTYGMSLNIKI